MCISWNNEKCFRTVNVENINESVNYLENWENIKGKYLFLKSEFEKIGN